ncbi:DUF3368 domain-containing protein [Synechococcus sp. PCC 6312]|uniref:DUF3368 domain-containing protein n=1 Tax=Synechococcus sp. (strain ATCC 27167 / PCC 6312) TaxID=195253 RepID=UPI00029EECCB|nr:DUF3368 domain-containing protein [Synechococcus sp. PCC 6312]AFY59471.1 putative nucleic acid-binding protein, contains PIN domain [Synechococcus sp. PCC 6312]
MITVSDTSPINNLAALNQLHLLHQLYGTILIPNAVYQELTEPDFDIAGSTEVKTFNWIRTCQIKDATLVNLLSSELGRGEAEVIALGLEVNADQVLIDEPRGREVAARFGLSYTGILGILLEAKHKGFLTEVKPILNDLVSRSGF